MRGLCISCQPFFFFDTPVCCLIHLALFCGEFFVVAEPLGNLPTTTKYLFNDDSIEEKGGSQKGESDWVGGRGTCNVGPRAGPLGREKIP